MTFSFAALCAGVLMWWSADDGASLTRLGRPVYLAMDTGVQSAAPVAEPNRTPPPAKNAKTAAERIAELSRALDDERKQLKLLQTQLASPSGEYQKAEAEFKTLDLRRAEKKKELQKLRDAGKQEEADKCAEALETIEKQWGLARDRFNLVIEERKTLQEKTHTLQEKIERDQGALDKLMGKDQPAKTATPQPPAPTKEPEKKPAEAAKTPALAPPTLSAVPVAATSDKPASTVEAKATTATPVEEKKPVAKPTPELIKAQEVARGKQEAAREANDKVSDIVDRKTTLTKNIEVEQRLLDTAQRKVAQAQESKNVIAQELARKEAEDTDPAELSELRRKLRDAERLIGVGHNDIKTRQERLDGLRQELAAIEAESRKALQDARRSDQEAAKAQQKVEELQNPFALHNVLRWLAAHGPRLLTILFVMLGLHAFVKHCSRRIIHFLARRGSRGSTIEGESRAQTLVGVFRNAAALLILGGGTLMLLEEVGIPIIPLLGGAAVLGLAVAFGAQNLIRDYFSGFMILIEDEYGINDVVKIGTTSGLVERISLRMTVVRDLEGVAHFIPHGTITTVSNMTHGHSRALFDIPVPYHADVDRVMALLMELGRELRRDPVYGPMVVEDPEMLGVDAFADSAVIVKFFIKTRPLTQWRIKRELLYRIKRKFDEVGIEIPFPQRTVHHRFENAALLGSVFASEAERVKRAG